MLVVLLEGALEDGGWHLDGADGLGGIDLELVSWLSHFLLELFIIIIVCDFQ